MVFSVNHVIVTKRQASNSTHSIPLPSPYYLVPPPPVITSVNTVATTTTVSVPTWWTIRKAPPPMARLCSKRSRLEAPLSRRCFLGAATQTMASWLEPTACWALEVAYCHCQLSFGSVDSLTSSIIACQVCLEGHQVG